MKKSLINTHALPTFKDPIAGVPVSRVTTGEGTHLLPYYTANARSADGEFICCTYRKPREVPQACLYSLKTGKGRVISSVPEGILEESIAFHPSKPLVCYASARSLFLYDMKTEKTVELFRSSDHFNIHCEISFGNEHVVFYMYEILNIADKAIRHKEIISFHTLRNCRSYILSVNYRTGEVVMVWGDTAPLTHPVISPLDENMVLYANQGTRDRLQELFIIPMHDRDNRHPVRLYHSVEQRPIYVGHSFFTFDGWVGTQMVEFGGQLDDGSYPDLIGYNAVIRPDGRCDRRARCPGGNKPVHAHAAYANSWWVGDTYPEEGKSTMHLLSVMKNNWETGYCQAEPLLAHGCNHHRPHHVHARFTPDEKLVLFNSNYGGHCHVYAAQVEEFLAKWKDRVPFEKRPARYCHTGIKIAPAGPKVFRLPARRPRPG